MEIGICLDKNKQRSYMKQLSLAGGFKTSEKKYFNGRIIPYIMENKKCSKPPTRSCA